jgi:GT2 family glycosyltransferase
MSFPKVAILVLNFNGKKWLANCFSTLKMTDYPNFDIYLIDNASTDDSVNFSKKNFPWVKVIRYDKNYGFCEGYNKAVYTINAEYVVLLNNDTVVGSSGWLKDMVKVAAEPEVALIGAKLLFMGNRKVIDSVGGKVYRWTGPTNIGSREVDRGQYDNLMAEPFFVCGAAMLIKRKAFLEVGGFDSKLFAYSEDLDLCWRLRLKGHKIKYCPTAVIYHAFSGSWRSHLSKFYLTYRNFLRVCIKNYSMLSITKNIPFYLIYITVGSLIFSFLVKEPRYFLKIVQGIAWNLINFKDTIRERGNVQTSRRIPEGQITAIIGKQKCENIYSMLRKIRSIKLEGIKSEIS